MSRSGTYIQQLTGYKAFVPAPLPPNPELRVHKEMYDVLSLADRALAKMDGIAYTLPNISLFLAMYVRKEALLSSQIEGTEASLEDIFEVESGGKIDNMNDVEEVINYIKALNYGIKRLDEIPMSLRLLKEIHGILMEGVRGKEKYPGEFRKTQNWIGPKGAGLSNARFVPPAPHDMATAMNDLELYLHKENSLPVLIDCALLHLQFETIHPFLDGNGRLGRLLITFFLYWKKMVSHPLLYLSLYFKINRQEYYDRLNMVREKGDYEQWVLFFLKGVKETAESGMETIKSILSLQQEKKDLFLEKKVSSPYAAGLLDHIFTNPSVTINIVKNKFDISFQAASVLVNQFVKLGILSEVSGQKRNQRFLFKEYINLLAI